MGKRDGRLDLHLFLIVLISVAYFSYWFLLSNFKYEAFTLGYYDIGITSYSFYGHVNYAQGIDPLQYLVYFGHMCPFCVAITPVFALYQQPATLLFIQDAFLALATIATYLICRDLLKSRNLGFALAFAFLINPGVRGMLLFDFHAEAFVPLFYILSFYFYFKNKRGLFALSYLVLLSISETTDVVGFAMLLALLVYELLYKSKEKGIGEIERKDRISILGLGFVMTMAAFIFYYVVTTHVLYTYSNGASPAFPPITRLQNYVSNQITALLNPGGSNYKSLELYLLGMVGILVLLFGFGVTSLRSLIPSVILYSPWLVEVFWIHNVQFAFFGYQYYGYVVAGSMLAAIIGIMVQSTRKKREAGLIGMIQEKMEMMLLPAIITFSIISALLPFVIVPPNQIFFPTQLGYDYTQIQNALATIPRNASVMAQGPLATHLFYIRNLELSPLDWPEWFTTSLNISVNWFTPDFIATDKNLGDYSAFESSAFDIYKYMGQNYTVYYNSSGMSIFRRK